MSRALRQAYSPSSSRRAPPSARFPDRHHRFTVIALVPGSLPSLGVLDRGIVRNIFSTPALRTLGKYSYGLYLYHFPLAVLLAPPSPSPPPLSPFPLLTP